MSASRRYNKSFRIVNFVRTNRQTKASILYNYFLISKKGQKKHSVQTGNFQVFAGHRKAPTSRRWKSKTSSDLENFYQLANNDSIAIFVSLINAVGLRLFVDKNWSSFWRRTKTPHALHNLGIQKQSQPITRPNVLSGNYRKNQQRDQNEREKIINKDLEYDCPKQKNGFLSFLFWLMKTLSRLINHPVRYRSSPNKKLSSNSNLSKVFSRYTETKESSICFLQL